MRFDEYLQQRGISVVQVDHFDGWHVDVEGPDDWENVEARPGLRVWIWSEDPSRRQFCANAVLTMHAVAAGLDAAEVFAMLCDEQVNLVPGCHERYRVCHPVEDGSGIIGTLSSHFDSEFGAIGSWSRSRIISANQETLIAQLTITALLSTPVDWDSIQMTVSGTRATSTTAESGDIASDEHGGDLLGEDR